MHEVCALQSSSYALFYFFVQNGHSIEELARATNNQDIIEAIRRSRSTLKQDGQFIDLLLSYLQKGDEASAAKKEVRTTMTTHCTQLHSCSG